MGMVVNGRICTGHSLRDAHVSKALECHTRGYSHLRSVLELILESGAISGLKGPP